MGMKLTNGSEEEAGDCCQETKRRQISKTCSDGCRYICKKMVTWLNLN